MTNNLFIVACNYILLRAPHRVVISYPVLFLAVCPYLHPHRRNFKLSMPEGARLHPCTLPGSTRPGYNSEADYGARSRREVYLSVRREGSRHSAAIGTVIIVVRERFDTRCITRAPLYIARNNPRCVQPIPPVTTGLRRAESRRSDRGRVIYSAFAHSNCPVTTCKALVYARVRERRRDARQADSFREGNSPPRERARAFG